MNQRVRITEEKIIYSVDTRLSYRPHFQIVYVVRMIFNWLTDLNILLEFPPYPFFFVSSFSQFIV